MTIKETLAAIYHASMELKTNECVEVNIADLNTLRLYVLKLESENKKLKNRVDELKLVNKLNKVSEQIEKLCPGKKLDQYV